MNVNVQEQYEITYTLPDFEGPLDLLLHLISKHKIDIYDIPIFELVEQYIDYVRQMQLQDMEVASEFLEMAARLVYIKTVSLLPVHEEADVLKQELTGELIEYRDCKRIAQYLAEDTSGFNMATRNQAEIELDWTYQRFHEPIELFHAYLRAAGKGQRKLPPSPEAFSKIVSHHIVSVSSRIRYVLNTLSQQKKTTYISLFKSAESRSEMVATFLAVLELVKANRIDVGTKPEDKITLIQ